MDPLAKLDVNEKNLVFSMFVTAFQENVHESLRAQLSDETPLVGHQIFAFVSFAIYQGLKEMGVSNAKEIMDLYLRRFADNMSSMSAGITFGRVDYYGEITEAIRQYDMIVKKGKAVGPEIERAFSHLVSRFQPVDATDLFSTTVKTVRDYPFSSILSDGRLVLL